MRQLFPGRSRAGWRPNRTLGLALLVAAASGQLAASEAPSTVARGSYQVASWGIADGLPQSTVTGIVELPDGELWLSTFGGLVRFDGVRFEVFDLANVPGLPSNRITALAAAPAGELLLATQTGSIVRLADGEVVETFAPADHGTELIALAVSSSGAVHAREATGEVYRGEAGRLREIVTVGYGVGYHNLLALPDGGIWTGALRQLVRVDTGERFDLPSAIVDLADDGKGGIWLGLEDGLAHFAGGRLERVVVTPALLGAVTCLLPDGDGRLWVGNRHGPVELARQPDGSWLQVAAPFTLSSGVEVRSMHKDREGNLWVGSNGQGLFRVTPSPVSIVGPASGPLAVSALAPDGAGGTWFTAGCQGLFHVTPVGALTAVDLVAPGAAGAGCWYALALDRQRRLWVRARERLFVLEPAADAGKARVTQVPVKLPEEEGSLVADPDGSLWVASRGGRVERLTANGDLRFETQLAAELHSAVLAADGSLWLGGWGELFHLHDGRVERLGSEQNVPLGAVRALLPRGDGALLIGTYGGGLGVLRNGVVRRISTEQGLADNAISGFVEDGEGRIWVLANRGISVFAKGELDSMRGDASPYLQPVDFGMERGVPEGNFGSPAGFAAQDGRLWFGTLDGALSLDATAFPFNRVPPRVVIESLWLDDRRVPAAPRIEIPANTARVRFTFTTFARTAPARVRFRQRLEGVDRDWVDLGDRRTSSWTPAGPGTFRYEVEARNEDGIWSAQPAAIVLTVRPAWWQTTAFRVAALLLASGLLLGAHRLRLRNLRLRNRALRLEIEERQRAEGVAARLRHELEHVSRIASAGELATSLAHEVNQPLAAIVSNAQAGQRFLHLGESGRAELDGIFADIARQGQRASDVILRLRAFLAKEAPHRDALDLNEVVLQVLPLVRREIGERAIDLVIDFAPDLPQLTGDRVQLQQVVVNLVQNACDAMRSYPSPRRLAIASRAAGSQVELTVSDSGPGVPSSVAAAIFEPFVSTKGGGMGMGLSICRSLVESHGGTLTHESPAEGGARFRVCLPVASAAAEAT